MVKTIVVEDYNPQWIDWFKQISSRIIEVLGNLAIAIEHVGSTSVPHLAAKPIIDIDVVIIFSNFEQVSKELGKLGYAHVGDLEIPTREVFKILDEDLKGSLPPHHLYVCGKDSPELQRHLAFRDYLQDHKELVKEYGELKKHNSELFPNDIDAYIDAKDSFVKTAIKEAFELGYGKFV